MTDDFLDEMIAERTSTNPAFPAVLDAAIRRRRVDAERVADSSPEPEVERSTTGRKRAY